MSSLNCLTPKHFAKNHHKKGYKEIGWSQVKLIFRQDGYGITEPLHEEPAYQQCDEEDYEYIVWHIDEPIAEFKSFDDAQDFLKLKLKK